MFTIVLMKAIVKIMIVELKFRNQLCIKTLDHSLSQTVIFYMFNFFKQNNVFLYIIVSLYRLDICFESHIDLLWWFSHIEEQSQGQLL